MRSCGAGALSRWALLALPIAGVFVPRSGIDGRGLESMIVAQVRDALTKAPVADASVLIPSLARAARTDSSGVAVLFNIPHQTIQVIVRRLGYWPDTSVITVVADTVLALVSLTRLPPVLDTVTTRERAVTSGTRLRDFEMRRRMGIGRFLTDSALMKHPRMALTELMSFSVPGLTEVRDGRTVARRNCGPVDVYVDGLRLSSPASALGRAHSDRDVTDLRFVLAEDVAGVEYYSGDTAPVQYRRGLTCGVVLIWLKR